MCRYNTLQHTVTHCNTMQHTVTHCNALENTTTHCNTPRVVSHDASHVWHDMRCVEVCCIMLHYVAVCCSVLQCVAVCCSVFQCVAACSSMSQWGVSLMPHKTFARVPWLIHVRHDSLMCVMWRVDVWYDSFMPYIHADFCVLLNLEIVWCICTCDVPLRLMTWLIYERRFRQHCWLAHSVKWLIDVRHVTHWYVICCYMTYLWRNVLHILVSYSIFRSRDACVRATRPTETSHDSLMHDIRIWSVT